MQVKQSNKNPESYGAISSHNFAIHANHKAFRMLGDSIYSDKVGSMIREVVSNAIDAHKMAGKETTPVVVKLPSKNNRSFIVEDFGNGISHDDMINVYTQYFKSTKDTSNTEIGGFGLGAKTPFALTDSFTVESAHNGVLNIYVAACGAAGPTLTLMHTEETTKSGVVVTVNIPEEYSIDQFIRSTKAQLRWFDTPPEIISEDGCYLSKPVPFLSGDGFALYECNADIGYTNGAIIVNIGGIMYPLDLTYFDDSILWFKHFIKPSYQGANAVLAINMPIGSIDLSVSRETIAYSLDTIANITSKLTEVSGKLHNKVVEYLQTLRVEFPSKWEALVHLWKQPTPFVWELYQHSSECGRIPCASFNGIEYSYSNRPRTPNQISLFPTSLRTDTNKRVEDVLLEKYDISIITRQCGRSATRFRKVSSATKDAQFLSMENGGAMVIYHDHKGITQKDLSSQLPAGNCIIIYAPNEANVSKYLADIGYDGPVLKLSEMNIVHVSASKPKKAQTEDLKVSWFYSTYYGGFSEVSSFMSAEQFAKGGVYINKSKTNASTNITCFQTSDKAVTIDVTASSIVWLYFKDPDHKPLAGITAKQVKMFERAEQWVSIDEVAPSIISNSITPQMLVMLYILRSIPEVLGHYKIRDVGGYIRSSFAKVQAAILNGETCDPTMALLVNALHGYVYDNAHDRVLYDSVKPYQFADLVKCLQFDTYPEIEAAKAVFGGFPLLGLSLCGLTNISKNSSDGVQKHIDALVSYMLTLRLSSNQG